MPWKYRVVRYSDGYYGVVEIYTNTEGKITGWTVNVIDGQSINDLKRQAKKILKEIEKDEPIDNIDLQPEI